MKKAVLSVLALTVLFGAPVVSAKEGYDAAREAKREEMKKIKQAQREAKKAAPPSEKGGFWAREAERSGLSGARANGFVRSMNPVPFLQKQKENYEARKAAAAGK